MYGKRTSAIVCGHITDMIQAAFLLGQFVGENEDMDPNDKDAILDDLSHLSIDSMGKGVVIY